MQSFLLCYHLWQFVVPLTVSTFFPSWLGITVNYERHSTFASDETKHLDKINRGGENQANSVKEVISDLWTTLGALVFIHSPVISWTSISISVINHLKGNIDKLIPKAKSFYNLRWIRRVWVLAFVWVLLLVVFLRVYANLQVKKQN